MKEDQPGVRALFKEVFPRGWGVACAAVDDIDGVFEWIDGGADINLADSEGNTCLHHAIYNKNTELAERILDAGFRAFNQSGRASPMTDSSGHHTDNPGTAYAYAQSFGLSALADRLGPGTDEPYQQDTREIFAGKPPPPFANIWTASDGIGGDSCLGSHNLLANLTANITKHKAKILDVAATQDGRHRLLRWLGDVTEWISAHFSDQLPTIQTLFWPPVVALLSEISNPDDFIMITNIRAGTPARAMVRQQFWMALWQDARLPLPCPRHSPEALLIALRHRNYPLASTLVKTAGYSLTSSHIFSGCRDEHSDEIPAHRDDELSCLMQDRYATPWLIEMVRANHISLPLQPPGSGHAFLVANPYLLVWLFHHGRASFKDSLEEFFSLESFGFLEARETARILAHWVGSKKATNTIEDGLRARPHEAEAICALLELRPDILTHNHDQFWESAMAGSRHGQAVGSGALVLAAKRISPPLANIRSARARRS